MTVEWRAREPTFGSASLQSSRPLRDLVEERRNVAIIFADISGSTPLAARLDPEETREILRAFLTTLARRVQRFGGTIDKYIGDAVMAVFGAPVSHEDDIERALRTALAMREAMEGLNADLERKHGVTLRLRIGVNAGEVVAGVIAGDVQAAYTVVGDTVNMAQRLEVAARPGEILVGASARSAANAFDFEEIGPIPVKGMEQPLTAFRLLRANTERTQRGLAQHRMSSPMVGRDDELSTLTSLVDGLERGEGGMVALIGDAGSGKSRLLAELKRDAATARVTWLEGRCFTLGETTRYAPFVEALSRMAGIEDGDDDSARWSKVEARVRGIVREDVDEVLPFVAALIGISPPEPYASRLQLLSSEAMGRQVFRATRRFLTALARARPVVLAIEDLHWADASTIALVQHILRATADAPLLAIGTSRPDPSSPAAELRVFAKPAPRYTEVVLEPLTDAQTAVLIGNLLAVDDLPERLREITLRQAEGNPLYVEEIIRSLIDTGVVRREESTGRWRAAADPADIDLPDTIGGLILARLDRLDDRAKQVLRHAAIIGRSFRERLLKALQPEEDLDPIIARLFADEVLVERRRSADPEHMFKHVVIQQTVYESITRKQRRELHARVADAIVATYGDRLDEFVGALAYHYARAEQWEEALVYLERAGDQAGRVAADAEAVERYREAITAYDATGRGSALQLASLERKLGDALFRRGAHVEATMSLRSALARLGVKLPSSRGATTRALLGQVIVQSGHLAVPWLLPAPGSRIDPVVDERVRAYQTLAWIDHFSGNARRQTLVSLRMLNDCERSGHLPGINQGLLGTAIVCDALGLAGLADRYHRRNVALAEASGDPPGIGYAYLGLAYHEHGIGNWDESGEHWARGTEAFWRTRDLRRWGVSMWAVGLMKWRRGAPAGTKQIGEQMVQVADEGADNNLRGWGLAVLGRAQWSLGEDDEALTSLREAAAILRDVPDRVILVRTLGDIGLCLLRRGDLPAATKILEEALALIVQYEIHGYHSQTLHWLLEVYLEHWQRASETERSLWSAKVNDALRTIKKQARFDIEARPGLHRLRGRLAWLQGRRAEAEADWRVALELAERLRFVPELAWTHAEMGWWLNSREHLERASELFEQMGARGELARLNAVRASAQQR